MRATTRAGLLAACALLASCNPFAGPVPTGMQQGPEVQHVPYSGSFTYTVDPGGIDKDVYFVFTNPDLVKDAAQSPTVKAASIAVDGQTLPSPASQPLPSINSAPQSLADRIAEFNRNPFGALGIDRSAALRSANEMPLPSTPSLDTVGDGGSMWDYGAGGATVIVSATCRYVSPTAVTVADGTMRKLNIWVANNCWSAGGSKTYLVDQTMVDALAAKFLATGAGNDIYDWDTGVIGAEWGPQPYTNLISPNGEITILLSDIAADNSATGGIVGYFDSYNNFTTASAPSSNQRIMFVIDAVMYANPSPSTWAPTNFWPKIVFSTLAHEFQHMIQFYQKQVLNSLAVGTDTWINEMCSMIMEDLVADKLGVEGPRGVTTADGSAGPTGNTLGRIGGTYGFNAYSNNALAMPTSFGLVDYSVSYAFGAWLARNYGGADLLRRIVQSSLTDSSAVTSAAAAASGKTETMERLLEKWAASVLISDSTAAPAGYRYNTGGWTTSTAAGITYNLGSIDIFNYSPALKVYTATGVVPGTTFLHSSNVYYRAASGLAAAKTWSLSIPAGIKLSVVLK
jgi:hypothetical protein